MEPFLFNATPKISEAPNMESPQKKAATERTNSGAEKSFTTHLDKAVKEQQESPQSKTTSQDPVTSSSQTSSTESENPEVETIDDSITSQEEAASGAKKMAPVADQGTMAQLQAKNNSNIIVANILAQTTGQANSTAQQTGNNPNTLNANILAQATDQPTLTPQQEAALLQQLTDAPETFGSIGSATKGNQNQDSILGAQIQKILDGVNNPQQVVVRGSQRNVDSTQQAITAAITKSNLGDSQQNGGAIGLQQVAPLTNSNETISLRTNQKNELGSQRQDSSEQFIVAKANRNAVAGIGNFASNSTTDQGQNGQQATQQNTLIPLTQTSISETPSSFSQLITPAFNTPLTSSSLNLNGLPQTTLPSGNVVYEEQVMQQIQHQFNINANKAQSNINIRLHPAELGELKISLAIKEGTVRVNVIAQSHQTQEILERNMPKLKAILEEQGLFVDDISITQASQSAQDFNLFDEQFAGNSDYYPKSQKQNQPFADFDLQLSERVIHDTTVSSSQTTTSVNLTI